MHRLIRKFNDPLYKNSIFLIASSLLGAGTGFVFWVIAARFYSAEDVGLASAIVSVMGLIAMLSQLGFDVALVRFLPEREDKVEIINTCFTISLISSLILIIIFILSINIWSPSLSIIRDNKFLLSLFIVFTSLYSMTNLQRGGVFIGLRKTEYSFIQTIATMGRLVMLPFLVAFGSLGIFASFGIGPCLVSILGFLLIQKLLPSYKPIPKVKFANDVFHFALGNYFARIFENLPNFILPVIVVNLLGVEANAYFFIAWQISILLLALPRFTSVALLAESSYNRRELRKNVFKATKFIFLLLSIAIVEVLLFGKYILWIFGKEYAKNSFGVLLILVLGSIPFTFNALYTSVKRVQKEIKPVILVYGNTAVITLSVSYLLIQSMKLLGVGYAWIIGNGVVAGMVGLKELISRIKKA